QQKILQNEASDITHSKQISGLKEWVGYPY
ncbi:unnamed protein product, partial [marine sediment metagenome]